MNIIDHILKKKGIAQKELAKLLEVSPSQISKWKQGEKVSTAQEEKLFKLGGVIDGDLDWTEIVSGNQKNAKKLH